MTLEIQVLTWDELKNVCEGLNCIIKNVKNHFLENQL